jgi:hypothetical protein
MAGEDEAPPTAAAAAQSLSAITTASSGSSPRSGKGLQATRTPSFLQLARRTAARERIDDILEGGQLTSLSASCACFIRNSRETFKI